MTDSDQGIVAKAPETMLSGLLEKELFFPDGLLGFADCRRYKFRRFDPRVAGASPVFILEAVEQDVSFPLIHPDFVWLDYRLEIAPEVMTCLDGSFAKPSVGSSAATKIGYFRLITSVRISASIPITCAGLRLWRNAAAMNFPGAEDLRSHRRGTRKLVIKAHDRAQ